MGERPERKETTEYARKTVNSFLKEKEYPSALLLSHIYADIRLRSLLSDWINPPKRKWKRTSEILGRIDFRGLIIKCDSLRLLDGDERKDLDDLNDKRNGVAHESRLWKSGLQPDEEKKIERLCKSAIKFLERTTR